MADRNGSVSRLPALPEPPEDPIVGELFAAIRARGGSILNIHRTVGHAPKILRGQAAYAAALREQSSLPRSLQVLLVLRTAQVIGWYVGNARFVRALRIVPESES